MAIQVFTANQTLTASQLNTLQASDFNLTRNLQTGTSYTLQLSDRGKLVEFQNVGTITATVPAYSSVSFDIGDTIQVLNTSTGVVDFVGAAGVTISAADEVASLGGQWHRATLVNRAQNSWAIMGNTAQYIPDATIDIKTSLTTGTNYTLQLTDKNKFIKMDYTTTENTVTVPLDATVTFPEGAQIHIIQYGSGKTQVIPVSETVALYATPGAYLRAQYSSATLLKCDTNTWMLMGDLSAS